MNKLFADMVEKHTPKYNPHIMNGLACLYVPESMRWLEGIFKSASKSFPKGLTFDGPIERCTPQEEYLETTRVQNNKRIFDLADSSIYLVKLKFSFTDEFGVTEALPVRYMYLPFVEEAGIFHLGGTMYHVTGVLSDKVISPGPNSIFVRLIRALITFKHIGHSVWVDGKRETFNVVWSEIYRKASKERSAPKTTDAFSSIAHYLFAKYGLTETFRRYAGFVPTIGHFATDKPSDSGTVLCRSSYYGTLRKPTTCFDNHYKPSDIFLEIPTQHWNSMTAALVAGFFYVVDHFPHRIQASRKDDLFLWSVLLGHINFSGVYSEAKLYDDMNSHFASLDDYLDVIVQDKLKEIGWEVENFYDLIAKITCDFPTLLLGSQIDVNSMFNKNVEILYYMLSEIAFKIFRVIYSLRKTKPGKPLTRQHVIEAFNKNMTPRSIFHVQKNKMIVETVSYCGDHKFPKLTSKITEQESGSSKFRNKPKRVVLTEANHIHSSMVEAGNVLFLSKSNPMPNSRLNPYVKIDLKTGTLLQDPQFKEVLEKLQGMLSKVNVIDNSDVFETEIDVDTSGGEESSDEEVLEEENEEPDVENDD